MTVYNKFKMAVLAMMIAQPVFAITVEPVQVQSAPGELLYAEMNFRQADLNTPIDVHLATPEDLAAMGIVHQPPGHLIFFTRQNSNGTGVITITSSRPITHNDLNFVVKIKQGNAARLQHIKTSLRPKTDLLKAALNANERALTPVVVVSEQDIPLNLPVSTQFNPPAVTPQGVEKTLAVQRLSPPPMAAISAPQISSANIPQPNSADRLASAVPNMHSAPIQTEQYATTGPNAIAAPRTETVSVPSAVNAVASAPPAPKNDAATNQEITPSTSLTAQGEETVLKPALSAEKAKPTEAAPALQAVSSDPLVKKYAEEQAAKQEHSKPVTPPAASAVTAAAPPVQQATYVVQSNESLWAIAARIAQQQNRNVPEVMQQIKQSNEHAFIGGNINKLRKGANLNLETAPVAKALATVKNTVPAQQQNKPRNQSKYRLGQAEMSLVAENQKESSPPSANQNTLDLQTSKELSLKVMTAREKTVKLQRNVTDLELALQQKDQRIQLLNARLAQLQKQLQAQHADKKAN